MALFPDDLMKMYQRQRTNAALGAFAQGLLQSGAQGGGLLAGLGQGAAGASGALASGGLGDLAKLQYLSQAQEADKERRAQGASLAQVTGGYDPQSGIAWDTGRQGPGQPGNLLGGLTPQQRGLLSSLPEPTRRAIVTQQAFPAPNDMSASDLVQVPGPDGSPIYVPASQAPGKSAYVKPPEDPGEYRAWQKERKAGRFSGNYSEWKQLGGQKITVNTGPNGIDYGEPGKGLVWKRDAQGGIALDERGAPIAIPFQGGEVYRGQQEEAAKKETQEAARLSGEVPTASMVLDSIRDIRKEYKEANTPVFGTASIPFAQYSGSPAGKARSYIRNLKSPIAIGALSRLKETSATGASGFGALNTAELQLLLDDLGVLDADNTDPEIIMKTLDRIEGRYSRVIDDIKRNVTPERIKELGLEGLIYGNEAGTPSQSNPGATDLKKKYGLE